MEQQKIVIKVQMNSDKCRTKAMKIAATTDGTLFNFFFLILGLIL
jgi:hypothetical protein